MVDQLTEEEYAEVKEAFTLFDRWNEGVVAIKELRTLIRAIGYNPTQAELQDMIYAVDPNGTGTINFSQFVSIIPKNLNQKNEEELLKKFKAFDKYQNGLLSEVQVRQVLKNLRENLTNEEIDELMKDANIDDNGYINYEEFIKILLAK